MNISSSKASKKAKARTPAKGQRTLSSFFANTDSKSSIGHVKTLSQGSSDLTSSEEGEVGKKRKLSQLGNDDLSHNEPGSKRSSSVHSAPVQNGINELCGTQKVRSNSIYDNIDPDLFAIMKVESKLASKENSFQMAEEYSSLTSKLESSADKFRNKISPEVNSIIVNPAQSSPRVKSNIDRRSPKKSSPLQAVVCNIQSSLKEEVMLHEVPISEELFCNSEPESELRNVNKEDEEISDNLLPGNKKLMMKKESHDLEKSTVNVADFDDDFLFEDFNEPFTNKNETDKTNTVTNSWSNSNNTTLTDDFDDVFSDDWNGDIKVEPDLSTLQRCQVTSISTDRLHNLIVDALHVESQAPVTVTFMGFWKETRLKPGDFINIQATKQCNAWIVDNNAGFVVEQPDFLVSGTSVVGALFCARRGVLSDRFKGVESVTDCTQGASVMVIGNLVHELVQEVLKEKVYTKPGIVKLSKNILNSQRTATMLYSARMSMESCEKEISVFIPKIFHFIERYVQGKTSAPHNENFNGKIKVIRDIEENLWVPQLGVKGKVDVTVEANVNLKSRIMPLELKTGRASFSLEHRGQVILYTMMMAVTGQDVDTGLLLYLRENMMREIRVGHHEQRDLILLRNNLAYYLTRKPEAQTQVDSGLETESAMINSMELPEPINHRACQNCPYSALCCAYLKDDKNFKMSDRHSLTPIIKELDNYLKPEHIEFVKRWVKMLQINEADQINEQPLRNIWTVPPSEREKKGKCIANLKITGKVIEECSRFRHTFVHTKSNDLKAINDFSKSGFSVTDYIIVSTNTRINVCAGFILELSKGSIIVSLEKNLMTKKLNDIYHIDTYSSQSMLIMNLSNIGYLLDDNTVTERMRKIIIEREPATFLNKLDRSVAVIAARVLKPLNKMQQRAALKVLVANDYLLIKGMPGSGKTMTLVAIIELLVKMGKSVLLTAHTHSAVDNVLLKLIETDVDFVRLGSSSKIHPLLLSKSESVLTQECYSPESLDAAYNSKNVVCVTCLGSNHPLLARRMFDVCLVDESTQVLQSSILRPLYSASKFVLIGDPDQLPPVVKNNVARKLGMDESLFERLDSDNNTIVLTSQYRMNERIMSLANHVTYKGQLTIGTDEIGNATLDILNTSVLNQCQQWVRTTLSTNLDDSVVVLDTGDKSKILMDNTDTENDNYHTERKYSNLCEAAVILRLVTTLIQVGVAADKIGVIAPYREQVCLLKDIIKQNIEVNTVDQYQGRDKEIILYSGTKSAYIRGDAETGFNILDDHRRLTVALTRAKHKLIIVGDKKTLRQFLPFKKLFSHMRDKDVKVLVDGHEDFMWEELLSVVKC